MQTETIQQLFLNVFHKKLHENPSSGSLVISHVQTETLNELLTVALEELSTL
jgi:hypothetical protein